ncbi:uncharacterized protein CTHT_0002470 [Thermochaetoides thermophila DSM 1495]|uniref:Uncharacterized protein n=1 Tax=Chaetomium thermophilum (strain DSM 1495 / CBS 144.50 / IMI 039719) TaxID=759272 RepID=G0RZC4_CHATD|nr:hypothetical protein CTHT_0002470 [Thermochaetoides thermophila DSM 1495]EGS23552.1 hypothetical protein CTHT_0002470 [Thermochaetoides thermophila DSM 1495]
MPGTGYGRIIKDMHPTGGPTGDTGLRSWAKLSVPERRSGTSGTGGMAAERWNVSDLARNGRPTTVLVGPAFLWHHARDDDGAILAKKFGCWAHTDSSDSLCLTPCQTRVESSGFHAAQRVTRNI